MRKTFKGRMTLKTSKDKPEIPQVVNVQIHVQLVDYNGSFWVDIECPSCKATHGLPLKWWEEFIKEAKKEKKKRGGLPYVS